MLKSRKCWIFSTLIKFVSKLGFLYQNFTTSTFHTSWCSLVVLGLNIFQPIQNPSLNQDLHWLKLKIKNKKNQFLQALSKSGVCIKVVLIWFIKKFLKSKLKFDIKIVSKLVLVLKMVLKWVESLFNALYQKMGLRFDINLKGFCWNFDTKVCL